MSGEYSHEMVGGMRRRAFVRLVAAAPFVLSARAQTEATSHASTTGSPSFNLTQLLAEEMRNHGLPALAAAAMKCGVVVAAASAGLRKFGDLTRVTIADKFHLGSCTKAMTATLAAIFVERGRIRWDGHVHRPHQCRIHHRWPGWNGSRAGSGKTGCGRICFSRSA